MCFGVTVVAILAIRFGTGGWSWLDRLCMGLTLLGVLAWIVAPWLRDQLGGDEPLAQALLICITAGLIWQFVWS